MTIQNKFINYINPNNISNPTVILNQSIKDYKTNIMHLESQKFINDNINSGDFNNNEKKIALILTLNDVYKDNYPEYYPSSTGLMFYNETLNYLDKENLKYQIDIINRINFETEYHLETAISSLITKINEKFELSNYNKEIINQIIEKANYGENKILSDDSKKILQNELNNFSTKESDSEFSFGVNNNYLSDEESEFSFGVKEPKRKIDIIEIENELNPISKKTNQGIEK